MMIWQNHAKKKQKKVSGDRCVPQIAFRQIMKFDYNAKRGVIGKSKQVYRQLGHDGKSLHANLYLIETK